MKKLVAALLLLCLCIGLCACGNDHSKESNLIIIWHDKEEAVASVLEDYLNQTLGPDIEVRLERMANLTEALKLVGNDPTSAPDMYFFAHDKIGVYAEMGILAPITDFIGEDTLSQYLPITLGAAAYRGTIYQLPLYFETLLYMYNRRYMSDDEVPATTEELYSYMQQTTVGGHYGFVEQHSTAYYAAGWIHAFGGSIITEDGVPTLDSDQTIASLEYHLKFVDLMPGESEYATVNTLLTQGMAHSTIGGPWMVPAARAAGIDLGIAAMPVVDQTGLPLAPYSGVQGIQVLKIAAENKRDTVLAVLEALLDPEIGVSLATTSGCAPANEQCYEYDEIMQDDMVMAMRSTAENAVPMPNIPEMDVMWTVVSNLLSDVNLSRLDITESAEGAQQEALDLIEAMR